MKLTDETIKKLCSSMIYKRGAEYFREGRVHIRKRAADSISAVVDGEALYNVQISFDKDNVSDVLCSCPYYETMHSPCKHIVAVLKQRQAEIEHGGDYRSENDNIAAALCREFIREDKKQKIRASFTIYITRIADSSLRYEMSVSLPDAGGEIQGLENFLDSYIHYTDFKLGRNQVYNRHRMYFPEKDDRVLSILADVYETRSVGSVMYHKEARRTAFGSSVIRHILPLMSNTDFRLIYDGVVYDGIRILNEDPDIILDIEAYEREISMSLSETGLALTPDGEWFMHNYVIYRTSPEWREYFMPLHRALVAAERNEIIFKGDNTMLFAKHVLPILRNRHGVVINGVDDMIVNSEPKFEICFDAVDGAIIAVVAVSYGDIKFRIPTESGNSDGRIIVRDVDRENRLLSYFNRFDREKSVYRLSGDRDIYYFIKGSLPELSELANVIFTDRFKDINIQDDTDLSVSVAYKRDIDFLEINFDTDLTPDEIRGILASMRLGHDFFRASDGRFIDLGNNKKTDLFRLLERLDITNADIYSGKKKIPKYHMLYLQTRHDVEKDRSLREYIMGIKSIEPVIPEGLKDVLRGYQYEGVRWLTELSRMDMGGILADDMGLGKTLQVIAYIHGIRPEKPVLVITPSTLTYNWQREIEKFTPDAKTLVVTGPKEIRAELLKTVNNYEFIITSYPLLRRDTAIYKSISFSYCFIDEAQYIKNPKTMNAVSVKRIRADHKFALTGTPIENSLTELWSIFDFVMPGYLKSIHEFRDRYEAPIMKGADTGDALRSIIRPFVLRRMKNDVLNELPEKIETVMLSDMNREQKALYMSFLDEARSEMTDIMSSGGNRMLILTMLLRLRQICCHPSLFTGSGNADNKGESGKLDLLMELITSGTSSGHRILVFSQFRSMLDIIARVIEQEHIDFFYINGATPAEERARMAEEFNSGERSVFLVSLKAGGTGLNLIGADMVIHYDPWWNPAVTDQATDRAHRIGQTRSVQVIKLAARGTIEEKILKLQERKRSLADDIIKVNSETIANLTDDEIMSLFEK
ncbi:MAG: DEAD/DEAH box helicase [Clostridia bacterium]|nr:DEAD/DEAH box helicase [Clostridia bacterium]